MLRKITLLLFTCCIYTISFSQILTGAAAQKVFPGAEMVRLDEKNSLPAYIKLSAETNLSLEQAVTMLSKHAKTDRQVSFKALRDSKDQMGMHHYRYQQVIDQKAVIGGDYVFHVQDDQVRSMNGILYDFETANTTAHLSEREALDIALAAHPGATFGWETKHGGGIDQSLSDYPEPELVWVPMGLNFEKGDFRLAYRMDIYAIEHDHHHRSWVYVDAENGEVIAEENRICEIDVPSIGRGVYTGTQDIITDKVADGLYHLRQSTYGSGVITLNMQNQGNPQNAIDFMHEDSLWGLEIPTFDRFALDAHFATEQYYLLLNDYFDRQLLDENNPNLPMICYVHTREDFGNAFWNGSASFYGDGDGSFFDNPLTTIDIVAHEFTHGLTQFSAGLIYTFEPGSLNESFSDIFGIATDFRIRPDQANWRIGEESTADNNGIRDARVPNTFDHPDTYFGDNWRFGTGDSGGVHSNSGVQNYWFYLLSEGGTGVNDRGDAFEVEGIGWEKALAVAYRNLTVYLTSSSHYRDAAFYGSLSAADLFGPCSQEYRSTVNAWYAVGLGEPIGSDLVDFRSRRLYCNAPAEVAFYNESVNFESLSWDFGDGNMSTENAPVHTYFTQGTFDVSLTVNFCGGVSETITKTTHIVIDNTDPICTALSMTNADTTILTACSGTVLDPGGTGFYDNDINSTVVLAPPSTKPLLISFESVNLGRGDYLMVYDGPNANAPVLAQYARNIGADQTLETSAGVATLVFTSNDVDTLDGFSFSYSIAEADDIVPEAAFTVNGGIDVPLNAPVTFADNSNFAGIYEWDFGDGNTSTAVEPTHQYTSPGTYTVTQRVINCAGADEATIEVMVGAGGIINLNPDSICITLNAGSQLDTTFTVSNSGLGDLYYAAFESSLNWLILEEETGTLIPDGEATVQFNFDASGLVAGTYEYNIPLESGDPNQFNLSLPVKMTVLPFPQNNFTVDVNDICNGIYQFTDGTLNMPTSWLWNFGDGNTSTDNMPQHQYAEDGIYDVSMIACNDLGCDTLTQEQLVFVNYCDTLTIDQTGFTAFDNCNGLIYDQGGPDGNYVNNADYIISIAPVGADEVTLTFYRFQLQPNVDKVTIFDGADTLAPILDIFSGSLPAGFQIASSGAAITLRFESNFSGNFAGFEIGWTCGDISPPGTASLEVNQITDCDNGVLLEASPAGAFLYTWDMGDGNIVTTETASLEYYYQTAGNYDIELIVSNTIGAADAQAMVEVSTIPFSLDATLSSSIVNINEVFSMEAVLDITPASYEWTPEPGVTLINAMADYFYTTAGNYTIALEVTDVDGCRMMVEKAIEVRDLVSTQDAEIVELFRISPNPSSGRFNVSLDFSQAQSTELILFNTMGQLLHRESLGQIQQASKELDFSKLPAGVYFLALTTERGSIGVQRLVIQH